MYLTNRSTERNVIKWAASHPHAGTTRPLLLSCSADADGLLIYALL